MIEGCPPLIVSVRRRERPLAARTGCQAEAVLMRPLDSTTVAKNVSDVLQRKPPEDRPG